MSYDSTSTAFVADATPLIWVEMSGGTPRFVTGAADFDLNILVDNSGNLIGGVPGDDLVVTGDIDLDGDTVVDVSGVLLTGEVTGFGFMESGTTDEYDFLFTVTGGALASFFADGQIGVDMTSENSTFTGSFEQNFNGLAKGTLGLIPDEPELAELGDLVWKDSNFNGIQDEGEPGVEGVFVELLNEGGDVIADDTTDANGNYLFTDLEPGNYRVRFTAPDGMGFTIQNAGGDDQVDSDADPITGETPLINLSEGESDLSVDAGVVPLPGMISGYVFKDKNENMEFDEGDYGIKGVKIRVWGTDDWGREIDEVVWTDKDGFYKFNDVFAGTYKIIETQPKGYLDGKALPGNFGGNAGENMITDIVLPAEADAVYYNFSELCKDPHGHGDKDYARVGGRVYHDKNNDGWQNEGEYGIRGVEIRLHGYDEWGNLVQRRTWTNKNGHYMFNYLKPGKYTIKEMQPYGWQDGKDTLGNKGGYKKNDAFRVHLKAGMTAYGYNFGELYKKNDDPQVW